MGECLLVIIVINRPLLSRNIVTWTSTSLFWRLQANIGHNETLLMMNKTFKKNKKYMGGWVGGGG